MADGQIDHEPRAVVLGGTGFVGEALARYWANSVARPSRFLVHRSKPEWLSSSGMEVEDVDLTDPARLLAALRGHDVFINLLRPDGSGWYRGLMESLNSVFRDSGIPRCIHASSIDVYAGVREQIVDETTPPRPISPYETEHLAAEEIVLASFPETIVCRLGAVFGRGGRNLVSLAEEMRRAPQWKIALRRSLYGTRRMHLVSVETVARALVHLALSPSPLGSQIVLVTDDIDPDNNFAFVQDRLALAFRRDLPGGPAVPRSLLRLLLRLRGLPDRSVDRRFSHRRASELGLVSEAFADRLEVYAQYLAANTGRFGE